MDECVYIVLRHSEPVESGGVSEPSVYRTASSARAARLDKLIELVHYR